MINSNELRLGNLLSYNSEIGKVTGLGSYGTIEWQGYYPLSKLQPIPLTEEILLKIGFNETPTKIITRASYKFLGIRIYMSNSGLFYFNNKIINGLHHLQNIVHSNTGQELNTTGLI